MSEYCTTRSFLVNWANLNVSRCSRHCVFFSKVLSKALLYLLLPLQNIQVVAEALLAVTIINLSNTPLFCSKVSSWWLSCQI